MRTSLRLPFLVLAIGTALISTSPRIGDAIERRHTRLVRSVPAKDTVITVAPATLELYFNERIQLAVSRVRLETAGGDSVALGALQRDDSKPNTPVTAAVRGTLRAGRHVVRWSTASRDGHVVRDSFAFTLRQP